MNGPHRGPVDKAPVSAGPKSALEHGEFQVNPPARRPLYFVIKKTHAKDHPGNRNVSENELLVMDEKNSFALIEFFDTEEQAQAKVQDGNDYGIISQAGDTISIRIPK